MDAVTGLDWVVADHFKPFRVNANANRFELPHAVLVGFVPLCVGVAIAWKAAPFVAASSSTIIGVYAVVASVMTAIMPTINGLLGPVDMGRVEKLKAGPTNVDANIREAQLIVAKVEIVRGLYAAVAWSVLTLCVSLVPLILICHPAFQGENLTPPAVVPFAFRAVRAMAVVVIGFAGGTSMVALLQIVSGVHLMNRQNQAAIEGEIQTLTKLYRMK